MTSDGNPKATERRRVKRRSILEQFSFYICIPKLGYTRHNVLDISELGIGIMIDTLGEFRLEANESCELHFYVNQSLHLPLRIKVMRTMDREDLTQEVGAIFLDTETSEFQTFLTLVKLTDQLSQTAKMSPH